MSNLVIVESPAKAKTIKKYLGSGYEVVASMGHIRDLPKSKIGVDIERLRTPPKHLGRGREPAEFFRWWTAREATVKRRGQGIAALMRGEAPDPLCRCLPDLLPGWVVTVCPSVDAPVRALRMEGSDDESRDQPPK